MGMRLELKKQPALTDLVKGKIFLDFELITEVRDCEGTMKAMTTVSQESDYPQINQKDYHVYVDNGEVISIETKGQREIKDKQKYDAFKQELTKAGVWL